MPKRKYLEIDGKYYEKRFIFWKRYIGTGTPRMTDEQVDEAIRINKTGEREKKRPP